MFHEWFTKPELASLNSKLEWQQQRDQQQDARIEELRADLERMSLLAKTLAELCVERGVLTREQLHDRMLAHDPRRAANPYENRRA
jgi:multidrug resistance efflux pump